MKYNLAGCIITDNKGRVLLLHRNTPQRVEWELPGGKIEQGETPEQAAKREIREELGCEVLIKRKIGETDFSRGSDTFAYNWYEAVIVGGVPAVQELNIHDELKYFNINEVHKIKVSLNIEKLYQAVLDGSVTF